MSLGLTGISIVSIVVFGVTLRLGFQETYSLQCSLGGLPYRILIMNVVEPNKGTTRQTLSTPIRHLPIFRESLRGHCIRVCICNRVHTFMLISISVSRHMHVNALRNIK